MRERTEEAKRLRPRLEAEWWQARGIRVREIQASLPEEDRSFLQFHIERVVRQKAWLAALERADDANCGSCVTLTEAEVKACLQRVRSQPAVRQSQYLGSLKPIGSVVTEVDRRL